MSLAIVPMGTQNEWGTRPSGLSRTSSPQSDRYPVLPSQPPLVPTISDDHRKERQNQAGDNIDDVVIPAIHRRENERHDDRQAYPEIRSDEAICANEHDDRHRCVATRKSVSLDPLESVQEILYRLREQNSLELFGLEMIEGKPRTDRRKQNIPDIREVETE